MRCSLPILASLAALLGGCVAGHAPANYEGAAWMPQQRAVTAAACAHAPTALPAITPAAMLEPVGLLLAPGDRLRLDVMGDEDVLSGVYVISDDGHLRINGIGRFSVNGLTREDAEQRLYTQLVAQRLVRPLRNAVRMNVLESAGVSVAVSGAVFSPGSVRAGERNPENRIGQSEGAAHGDANVGRSVSTALRAAGGVRPDANVRQIGLIRHDRMFVLDMRASHDGTSVGDIMLTAGDRLIVPSTGCFDANLVRPSVITQPGIRVHMSNLTRPANNNAGAAIGERTGSLPYGTRFLQGLVAMNCVGGSAMNAGRRAVLISRNPITGQSVVVEREIEELVRHSDRDDFDPYLMPGDALACYDSRWMNFRDAVSLVSDAASGLTPAILLEQAVSN